MQLLSYLPFSLTEPEPLVQNQEHSLQDGFTSEQQDVIYFLSFSRNSKIIQQHTSLRTSNAAVRLAYRVHMDPFHGDEPEIISDVIVPLLIFLYTRVHGCTPPLASETLHKETFSQCLSTENASGHNCGSYLIIVQGLPGLLPDDHSPHSGTPQKPDAGQSDPYKATDCFRIHQASNTATSHACETCCSQF